MIFQNILLKFKLSTPNSYVNQLRYILKLLL